MVADNASLADALADEEPAGHLGHDDGVDGCLLHGGLSPLEGEGVSNKFAGSLDHGADLAGAGRGQLNLRGTIYKYFNVLP